ncbi:MAG: adenylosuccinate synthase [bacterium]|nr:adenylosuccinate synthase [bacterium]
MKNTIVIGAYWGDEGKGKIVDLLAENTELVIRYNGGDNAGHTIVVGDKKTVLHVMPSGIIQGKDVAIGPDVFVNPKSFFEDYKQVEDAFGVKGKILIDERAHIIMPYHIVFDAGVEEERDKKIGTTKRGIGPVAKDKAARTEDISAADLVGDHFREKLQKVLLLKIHDLIRYKIIETADDLDKYADEIFNEYSEYAKKMKGFVCNVSYVINNTVNSGKFVLIEGAQGALLDVVHGTRPYVTSSNTTAGGAYANLGVNPKKFNVVGIAKAYPTRVGEGPFPTQLDDELGAAIQKDGHEFGATTGRPRKAGMPDFVALRYSGMINAVDEWAITKLDVLAGKKFKAAIAYEKDGKKTDEFPFILDGWKPVYDKEYYFDVLSEDDCIEIVKKGYDSMPEGIKDYLKDLVKYTGVPVGMISLSPKRDITLIEGVLEKTKEYLK